jgi:glyoxalase family protein
MSRVHPAPSAGIHHITAIASDPQRNHDFYTKVLGLRLVKKTVNFDDPGSYHLYFGDRVGSPGTILTFFPWPGAHKGRQGAGSQTATTFAIPIGSMQTWKDRLASHKVDLLGEETRFGQTVLRFTDHDGMGLELIEAAPASSDPAIVGFHSATLTVRALDATARTLVDRLGFTQQAIEGSRTRFKAAGDFASVVDVVVDATGPASRSGAGIVHHIAYRAADDAHHAKFLDDVAAAGHNVSPVMDRNYFHSIYFREPGGVLFEIATDNPGFAVDESVDTLGTALKLPEQYEAYRAKIEAHLPKVGS